MLSAILSRSIPPTSIPAAARENRLHSTVTEVSFNNDDEDICCSSQWFCPSLPLSYCCSNYPLLTVCSLSRRQFLPTLLGTIPLARSLPKSLSLSRTTSISSDLSLYHTLSQASNANLSSTQFLFISVVPLLLQSL